MNSQSQYECHDGKTCVTNNGADCKKECVRLYQKSGPLAMAALRTILEMANAGRNEIMRKNLMAKIAKIAESAINQR